jgi:hypothetical protein
VGLPANSPAAPGPNTRPGPDPEGLRVPAVLADPAPGQDLAHVPDLGLALDLAARAQDLAAQLRHRKLVARNALRRVDADVASNSIQRLKKAR